MAIHKVGLFEAKQKLSELVARAQRGERIGITRHGKLAAVLAAAEPAVNVKEIFDSIEQVRRRARRVCGVTAKRLIAEGRI